MQQVAVAPIRRANRRWPKGTWMRLVSAERLRSFVGPDPDKKISGRKLARAVGVHPSFIDHLLMGRRNSCTPLIAERITEVLAVPLDVIFVPEIPSNRREIDQRHEARGRILDRRPTRTKQPA